MNEEEELQFFPMRSGADAAPICCQVETNASQTNFTLIDKIVYNNKRNI